MTPPISSHKPTPRKGREVVIILLSGARAFEKEQDLKKKHTILTILGMPVQAEPDTALKKITMLERQFRH